MKMYFLCSLTWIYYKAKGNKQSFKHIKMMYRAMQKLKKKG